MNEDFILNRLKEAWMREFDLTGNKLTEDDLRNYLKGRSRNINQLFRTGLIMDFVIKVMLGSAFAGSLILYPDDIKVTLFSLLFMIFSVYSILFHANTYRKIPDDPEGRKSLISNIEEKISFYRSRYIKSVYAIALSSPMLFISGSLYYFYFKYGTIRQLDQTDIIIMGVFLTISFVFPLAVQLWFNRHHIRQLEECMNEIREGAISELLIMRQRRSRLIVQLVSVIALITGMLLLLYIIFS